jgi:hypothetical protein
MCFFKAVLLKQRPVELAGGLFNTLRFIPLYTNGSADCANGWFMHDTPFFQLTTRPFSNNVSNKATTNPKARMHIILAMVRSTGERGNTRSPAHTMQENTKIQTPNSRLVQLIKYRKNCSNSTKSSVTEKKLPSRYTRKKNMYKSNV